jgi:predicted DsbA family dithiol-disulfide isomerase
MIKPMRARLLCLIIVGFAACGAWLSGELLRRHDDIWRLNAPPGALFSAICGAGGRLGLDCQQAANDRWSEITVPRPGSEGRSSGASIRVPVPFLGLAYFSFVGIWFGCVGWPRGCRLWDSLPPAVIAAGATGSLFFLALMITGRARPCPPCILADAISLLIVVLTWRLWRASRQLNQPAADAVTPDRPLASMLSARHALTALTFWAVVIAGFWFYRGDHLALAGQWHKLMPYKQTVAALREDEPFLLQQYMAQPPRSACSSQPGDPRPHLVAFIDYECPNCSCSLATLIENARRKFPDLDVQVRHFPLCSECNPDVKGSFHQNACRAAYAAEAARLQGGEAAFSKMHELLIQHRGELDASHLVELSHEAGLYTQRLARDLAGAEVRQRVAADVEAGRRSGVTGTPSVFFQARRVDPRFEGPAFWNALAGHFSATATSSPASELTGKVASTGEIKK